jgi:hypothetical protein
MPTRNFASLLFRFIPQTWLNYTRLSKSALEINNLAIWHRTCFLNEGLPRYGLGESHNGCERWKRLARTLR